MQWSRPAFKPIQAYKGVEGRSEGQHFIHEMTHVWQYRNNASYIEYVAEGYAGRLTTNAPGEEYTEKWDT